MCPICSFTHKTTKTTKTTALTTALFLFTVSTDLLWHLTACTSPRFAGHMPRTDPTTNAYIEELMRLAAVILTPEAFTLGLTSAQAHTLLTLHESISSRYGARAASRAVSRLGGITAVQQLLRARHTASLGSRRQAQLMSELDLLLDDTEEIDRIRAGRPSPPESPPLPDFF